MNKTKFFSSMLVVALFATASVVTSCKDYDDDIKNLQSQIDEIGKTVDQINSLVTNGYVLTDVKQLTDGTGGIEVFMMKNGSTTSYKIMNGANGTNGINGTNGTNGKDADVWTIGNDGYWYLNGVKQSWKAVGTDGTNGKDGVDGKDGKDGVDGKDGKDGKDGVDGKNGVSAEKAIYYAPCTDKASAHYGEWIEVNPNKTPADSTYTGKMWLAENAITAIMDNGDLLIKGVEGYEDGIRIAMNNALRSLVFEKDAIGRFYTGGVPAIRVASFKFKDLKTAKQDDAAEWWKEDGAEKVINPTTLAYYHVNPSNVNVDSLKKYILSYVVKPDAEYARRAKSVGFAATPKFKDFKNGILTVEVNVTGKAATDEYISVAALQATKGDASITSDYAAFVNEDLDQLRLYNKTLTRVANADDLHFRRVVINDAAVDATKQDPATFLPTNIENKKVWDTTDGTDYDLELVYNDSVGINLYDVVGAHAYKDHPVLIDPKDCLDAEELVKSLGLTLKFEVVKNYKIGTNNTDQADFITLHNDSVITARVFTTTGRAAIGRTPIIRAKLMKGSDEVEVAYIKVKIVEKETPAIPSEDFVIKMNDFTFKCDVANNENPTTVEQINVQLYNELQKIGVSREYFYTNYQIDGTTLTQDLTADPIRVGEVEETTDASISETTHLLKWTVAKNTLWENAGDSISHTIKYVAKPGKTVPSFTVKLIAKVKGVKKVYTVETADHYNEYWTKKDGALDKARFNVNVPTEVGQTSHTNTLFENDLNSPFVTYPRTDATKQGILKLDEAVTSIKYQFHKHNEGKHTFKINGQEVVYWFKIANVDGSLTDPIDSLGLIASKGGTAFNAATAQLVAKISNNQPTIDPLTNDWPDGGRNKLELYYDGDETTVSFVEEMLNTKELALDIKAIGYVCGETDKDVKIEFVDGESNDYYTALFIRPVNPPAASEGNFIDGVDLGETGSYLNIMDMVRLSDWRGRVFGSTYKADFSNYWNYWLTGTSATTLVAGGYYNVKKIELDVTSAEIDLNGTPQPVPATIVLNGYAAGAGTLPATVDELKSYNAPFGYVTYKNNGTALDQNCNLYLKFKITYKWGEFLTDFIKVPVAKTTIVTPAPAK